MSDTTSSLSHFKSAILNIHPRLITLTGWEHRQGGVEDPPPTEDQAVLLGCLNATVMAMTRETREEVIALESRWVGGNIGDKQVKPWDIGDRKKWGLLVCYAAQTFTANVLKSDLSQTLKDAVTEEKSFVDARIRSYLKGVKP